MPENNDTNANAVTSDTTAGETGSASTGTTTGPHQMAPAPIFESFIYEFVKTGLGGEVGGRPGTIGGPIGGQDPKYRVLTYPFLPPPVPDIENT